MVQNSESFTPKIRQVDQYIFLDIILCQTGFETQKFNLLFFTLLITLQKFYIFNTALEKKKTLKVKTILFFKQSSIIKMCVFLMI